MHSANGLTWLASLALALSLAGPVQAGDRFDTAYLSEFLAHNRKGLRDENGDRPGWIELANGSSATVRLAGWFLTDNPTNLTKWRFPQVSLLPDKFLVVFASAKDRTNDLNHLHTNFRLDHQGNYLALVDPATNVVSEFALARQTADTSDGRVRGEPRLRAYFPRPTPGKPNTSSGPDCAPDVDFSPPGGNFTRPVSVELSCQPAGPTIRYTLDGTLPTSTSAVYAAPLRLTNTAHLRARAYQEGRLPGPPHSEAYLQLATNVLDFTSSLPVIILDTLGKDVPVSDRSIFARLSFHEPVNGRTSLTNPPTFTTRGGFHVRGSTSSGMPQVPFAVEFLNDFNEEQPHTALGLPADSDWVLYAPTPLEPVLIHNPFIHQLSRDMGRYSPRTRFVEVYLARTGEAISAAHYHGIYVLMEKIKIGKNRVDAGHLGANDLQAPDVTGGYLLKFDRLGPGESGFAAGGTGMAFVDPKEAVMIQPQRAPQRQYLQTFFDDFGRALNGPRWQDPAAGYRAFLDVPAAIDFHVLEVLSGNVDAIGLSTYFYKPRGGRIVFGPHWDFDRALGSTDGRDDNPRHWNTGPFFQGAWWPRLFSDLEFWQLWVDRWQELRRNHFSQTNLNALTDRLTDELREAQPRQVKRWGTQPRGGSYRGEINIMKNWLSNRVDFIDRQLAQPPRFNQAGGLVAPGFRLTLTAATNATIYYTVDGSDPRLVQGAVASNALTYTVPIPLSTSVRIVTRTRDTNQHQTGGPQLSTPWSGPVSVQFFLLQR
jgi:hypothetical protein